MTRILTPRTALSPLQPIALVLALAAAQSAWAEANPYYIGVSQGFTNDSNVFRSQSSPSGSGNTISSTGLFGGINQPISRQRVRLNGTVGYNSYSSNSNLNNTDYGLNAALDWSTVERLSGTLSYANHQNLANYATPNTLQITSRNLRKTEEFSAQALLGGVTTLSFTGGLTHRAVNYSAAAYAAQEFTQDAGSLGLRYRLSGALDVGSALRMTRGRYPNYRPLIGGGFEADTLRRRDLDLTANWTPTGLTTLAGRVSLGRSTHSISSAQGFSGVTGSLSITHTPAGRLRYSASLSRDTGAENSFRTFTDFNGNHVTGAVDNSQLSTNAQLSVGYEVTAKILANASLKIQKRALVDTLSLTNGGPANGTTGSDTVTGLSFGVSYAPVRNLALNCNIGVEKRSTTSTLSSDYSSNRVGCTASYTLQ